MTIQEIALNIDLSVGVFQDTVFQDQKLKLRKLGQDADGNPIYPAFGLWESMPILIQDKIASFKGIAGTIDVSGGATYKQYVSTSEDGFNWSTYEEALTDGSIHNAPAKYARIKIEIFAEKKDSNFYIDDYKVPGKYNNEFVESEAGFLSLKRTYRDKMDMVSSPPGGLIVSKKIKRTKFKKMDAIRVGRG
ncbi:hypothetical protein [Paenibacillus sp. LK1]|uniref:hypothetical protein n=1 Tax=Paenibacillus sp. LK1 TaxID=2053014 RepID=UPI000C189836|nr:hypothetical protein [Paenibacillus sp. LK1]PIH59775.1 hypothetical protein CS562_07500 [Paenibacillus sp. LK1]